MAHFYDVIESIAVQFPARRRRRSIDVRCRTTESGNYDIRLDLLPHARCLVSLMASFVIDPEVVRPNHDLQAQLAHRKERLSFLIKFINDNGVLPKVQAYYAHLMFRQPYETPADVTTQSPTTRDGRRETLCGRSTVATPQCTFGVCCRFLLESALVPALSDIAVVVLGSLTTSLPKPCILICTPQVKVTMRTLCVHSSVWKCKTSGHFCPTFWTF